MSTSTEPLLKHLHNQSRLRVWPLIITFFGDSIIEKGGEVEASRLKVLMQAMGIEAGTLRTALSRLTNDNWIERYKIGKNTIYRLGDRGLKEFGPASKIIYSPPKITSEKKWKLIITPDFDTEPYGFNLQPGVSIVPISQDVPEGSLIFEGKINMLSETTCYKLLPKGYLEEINQLIDLLSPIKFVNLNPLEAMIARTLVIHNWRKIVLKFPEVPNEFTPKSWKGYNIRFMVKNIYDGLTPQAETWLNLPTKKSVINFGNFKTPKRF